MRCIVAVAVLLALSGCATVLTGTTEKITISTNPAGAKCVLTRQNWQIATVNSTPGTVSVHKDMHDIRVTCDKAGYQTATQFLNSEFESGTLGNILLGGAIGMAIDSSNGADSKYPATASLTLLPQPIGSGTGSSQNQASASGADVVSVGCKLKNGTITSLPTDECKAKGGTTF